MFPVSPVSRVFYNRSTCNDLTNDTDALDLNLRDDNHSSCLAIPGPPPSSVIVRMSRLGVELPRTTTVLVIVQDIDCRPQGGLQVLVSPFCRMGTCGQKIFCTRLLSLPGKPCKFRCCDTGQPCGTFYLTLQGQAVMGTVCEVNTYH